MGETANSTKGRVEICFGGVWGTVCNLLWEEYDARVACRQLGLPTEGILCIYIQIITVYYYANTKEQTL